MMITEPVTEAINLPSGDYYIGDPCYVLSNEDYKEMLTQAYGNKFEKETHFATIRGHKLFVSGTSYGDGIFDDDMGNAYMVDSGQLSCVPMELVEDVNEAARCGTLNDFVEDFDCHPVSENGFIDIGECEIFTGLYDDEEEE